MLRKIGHVIRKLAAILLITVVFILWTFKKDINSMRREMKHYARKHQQALSIDTSSLRKHSIPKELHNIEQADKTGLVLDVKTISIRGVQAPYNASLIEHEDGYLLFFRYDSLSDAGLCPFYSYIGCVELDKNFVQTETEFYTINTQSHFSEDPRAIRMKDKLYLVYNDLLPHQCYCRTMRIAEVDLENAEAKSISILDPHISEVEKNWAPFIYAGERNQPEMHFQYHFNPHKILRLPGPRYNKLEHLDFPNNPCLKKIPWPAKWGQLKGGTPARLVNGEYLAFFHSTFCDTQGFVWYLMGAYTFSSQPPFEMTAISRYPILFKHIYETPPIETAPPLARVIFPAGFCLGKRQGKDVIYVSCGENDCAVKIVTIDKDVLFKSLRRF